MPEYWIVDPDHRAFRMLLRGDDGVYRDVPPTGGRYHSTVIDGLVVDPDELFAVLD